jgi:hypothetical protein
MRHSGTGGKCSAPLGTEEQSLVHERLYGLPDRNTAEAVMSAQLRLRGNLLPWLPVTLDDVRAQYLPELIIQRDGKTSRHYRVRLQRAPALWECPGYVDIMLYCYAHGCKSCSRRLHSRSDSSREYLCAQLLTAETGNVFWAQQTTRSASLLAGVWLD